MSNDNLTLFLKQHGVAERSKYEGTKPSHSNTVIHRHWIEDVREKGFHECSKEEILVWRKI